MVSCLCELVLFHSYCYKKSTLLDTLPKLVPLPWQQETQTSLCWSSFMATSCVIVITSDQVWFWANVVSWVPFHLKLLFRRDEICGTYHKRTPNSYPQMRRQGLRLDVVKREAVAAWRRLWFAFEEELYTLRSVNASKFPVISLL